MADAPDNDLIAAGLWVSVAELARQKGIARQSAHERVARLEADGLITVRREGRQKLVNLAEYDRVVGEVGDAAKETGAATKADDDNSNPAYRDHQAREKQYSADLKYLELNERLGKLIPVEQVEDAATVAIEAIARVMDRLPSHAEAIATAVGKDGPSGARAALKELAREIRTAAADAFASLGGKDRPDVRSDAGADDRLAGQAGGGETDLSS